MPAKKKTTAKKTTAKKTTAKRGAVTTSNPARPGDLIVVDSRQVGSPAREGEVLEVIEGEVRVSYRVRWLDGHESIFSPAGGSLHIASG
ncbi:MAG: DUF1918 domain-containing protein [Actinomycetota bacterium]